MKSSAVYCVSLQKYSVFSTMQGCIVPPKSNKLIACVQDVAKTCVMDSLKTVILFLSFQRFCQSGIGFGLFCKVNHLNKYGFRPPCPPCHLFNRSTDQRVDFVCTRSNRHTLDPPVRRGIMLERRSVLFAFALPSVRGTTAYHLTIYRGTFPHLPTVRPFKPSGLPVTIEYHVQPWLNI